MAVPVPKAAVIGNTVDGERERWTSRIAFYFAVS